MVNNSIFYNGVRILARMVDGVNNVFTNNVLIGVKQRNITAAPGASNLYNWAVLGAFHSQVNQSIANINITNNYGSGS